MKLRRPANTVVLCRRHLLRIQALESAKQKRYAELMQLIENPASLEGFKEVTGKLWGAEVG